MLAFQEIRPGPEPDLVEVSTPSIREDDVLLSVVAAGICGSDLHADEWDEAYAFAPGRILTPMVEAVGAHVNAKMVAATPIRRLGEPEEIADLVVYFSSSNAGFITGQICDVAGGWLMT